MPLAPMGATTSYGPSLVPASIGIRVVRSRSYLKACYRELALAQPEAEAKAVFAYAAYCGLLQLAHEAGGVLPRGWSAYPGVVRLLIAQGDHRLDARGPARRQPRRERRGRGEHDGCRRVGRGIVGAHVVELVVDEPRDRRGGREAEHEPRQHEPRAVPEDERQDVAGLRPECCAH